MDPAIEKAVDNTNRLVKTFEAALAKALPRLIDEGTADRIDFVYYGIFWPRYFNKLPRHDRVGCYPIPGLAHYTYLGVASNGRIISRLGLGFWTYSSPRAIPIAELPKVTEALELFAKKGSTRSRR